MVRYSHPEIKWSMTAQFAKWHLKEAREEATITAWWLTCCQRDTKCVFQPCPDLTTDLLDIKIYLIILSH